ncbi:MAG TPA: hypothetical protein VIO33_18620 [Burkholderiaceae bacterium]
MAVLHLEFDIDSEVYPELHDLLAAIGNAVSREERLRQLAATGLIWERTRLRAQADIVVDEAMPASVASVASVVSAGGVPAALAASGPVRPLPVLTDVVEPAEVAGPPPQAIALHGGAADSGRVGANDPVHDLPEERQKAHRSRLKRMKDKGLFKNE